jgi:hypothetical protein
LKKIDSSTNEVTGKYILDLCKFISEYKGMSKSTKQNRINFFMEENSKNPIFER